MVDAAAKEISMKQPEMTELNTKKTMASKQFTRFGIEKKAL